MQRNARSLMCPECLAIGEFRLKVVNRGHCKEHLNEMARARLAERRADIATLRDAFTALAEARNDLEKLTYLEVITDRMRSAGIDPPIELLTEIARLRPEESEGDSSGQA